MGTRPTRGIRSRAAPGGLSRPTARRKADPKSLTRRPAEITDEQIASRAYEIYEARTASEGDALSDWLRAERELRRRLDHPSSAAAPRRGRKVYP